MKKKKTRALIDELRKEYDFAALKGGVRGKHYAQYKKGTNLVLLSPDVAAHFPDDRSVNSTLRNVIRARRRSLRRSR